MMPHHIEGYIYVINEVNVFVGATVQMKTINLLVVSIDISTIIEHLKDHLKKENECKNVTKTNVLSQQYDILNIILIGVLAPLKKICT
jgi:hypothetical protein